MFEYRVELGDMVVTNLGTALPAISGKPAYHVADGGKKTWDITDITSNSGEIMALSDRETH
jgi:hypothetical protein